MENYGAVIIGGGAAGMACAASLSEKANIKIAIIEAGERLGKKLAATGNGQGNVSNTEMTVDRYHGSVAAFAEDIACGNKEIYKKLFNCLFTSDD